MDAVEERDDDDAANSVVFRLSNKSDSTVCLRAAYVAYEEFKPDPQALSQMSVFKRCLGLQDFHLIVSSVNAKLRATRKKSFATGITALVLIFMAVGLCIVSVPGGISAQFVIVLLQMMVQAILRNACKNGVNEFLDTHVNPQLKEKRQLSVTFRVEMSGLGMWCEIDFVSVGGLNPLERLRRRSSNEQEVVVSVEQRESGGDMDATVGVPLDLNHEQSISSRLVLDPSLGSVASGSVRHDASFRVKVPK